ncbi:MAG: hypothetical protein ABJA78_13160 [Ferruginibacter sp.]
MEPYFIHTFTAVQQPGAEVYNTSVNDVSKTEKDALMKLLFENRRYDDLFDFKPGKELFNFLQFTSSMLLAFPVGLYMRKKIRKNERLNYILQFRELLQVRNNIEKGSFAYDTILFKQSAFQILKNKSHLANLVCLAILFGDEFIDGIAAEHGKKNIQLLLNSEHLNYYLQYKKTEKGFCLYYEFDICDVLPQSVLQSINAKYGITYKAFYEHLQFLLQEMNVFLNKLNETKGAAAAELICSACNKCFDTYKADINGFNEDYSLKDLLQYQKTKDDDIIQVLLTLRGVLIGRKEKKYQQQFASWSSMVRSMQLYDDMQDVAVDCDFQMNVLCFFAKNYFKQEWLWLQKNKNCLQTRQGLALHSNILCYMPGSCMMAMQYARNISHTELSWVQRKIQNYLWRKNWLGFNNPLLNENDFCLSRIINGPEKNIHSKLYFIKKSIFKIDQYMLSEEMKWAHLIDIILMDAELKDHLFAKINRREKYMLTNCYVEFPIRQKSDLAKKLFTADI